NRRDMPASFVAHIHRPVAPITVAIIKQIAGLKLGFFSGCLIRGQFQHATITSTCRVCEPKSISRHTYPACTSGSQCQSEARTEVPRGWRNYMLAQVLKL